MQNRELNNVTDLRNSLLENYANLKSRKISPKEGIAIAVASKAVMETVNAQLKEKVYTKDQTPIAFLVDSGEKPNVREVQVINL